MPQLEEALYARLSGFAGLTALTGTRIYPMRAPATAGYPHVVYQRISTVRPPAFGVDTGVANPRFQVTSWAATPVSAKTVKEQVRLALERWRGTLAGVTVQDAYIAGEMDLVEEQQSVPDSGEAGVYGVAIDVMIWHREA
jgi:hypothetical protein